MKLGTIYRVIKFKQSNCLKEYIDFNNEKRKDSKNSFERSFFKLLVNSIYGKTPENIRKKINLRLINNAEDYVKCVNKPNFITKKLISKYFVAFIK